MYARLHGWNTLGTPLALSPVSIPPPIPIASTNTFAVTSHSSAIDTDSFVDSFMMVLDTGEYSEKSPQRNLEISSRWPLVALNTFTPCEEF